eukprot:PhM_4_TR5181/c2_g1_i1/m.99125
MIRQQQNEECVDELFCAIRNKDYDDFHQTLEACLSPWKDDVNLARVSDKRGQTLLHAAALAGQSNMVDTLLSRVDGIDVDALAYSGATPLILASHYGYFDIVKSLISAGADATIVAAHGLWGGQNAYAVARMQGHDKVANYLDEHTPPNHANPSKSTVSPHLSAFPATIEDNVPTPPLVGSFVSNTSMTSLTNTTTCAVGGGSGCCHGGDHDTKLLRADLDVTRRQLAGLQRERISWTHTLEVLQSDLEQSQRACAVWRGVAAMSAATVVVGFVWGFVLRNK